MAIAAAVLPSGWLLQSVTGLWRSAASTISWARTRFDGSIFLMTLALTDWTRAAARKVEQHLRRNAMANSKDVVVTGVSTGIGWGTTKVLVSKGFRVFGSVRNQADADRLQREVWTSSTSPASGASPPSDRQAYSLRLSSPAANWISGIEN